MSGRAIHLYEADGLKQGMCRTRCGKRVPCAETTRDRNRADCMDCLWHVPELPASTSQWLDNDEPLGPAIAGY